MPVGTSKGRNYLKLNGKSGMIEEKDGDTITEHNYIEGYVSDIEFEDRHVDDYHFQNYNLIFKTDGVEESLQFSRGTVAANGILNSLAWALEEKGKLGWIKIKTYKPNGARYTAAYLEMDGEKMDWLVKIEDQPKEIDKKTAYFHRFFERIKEKLAGQPTPEQVREPIVDQGGANSKGEPEVDLSSVDDELPF